MTHLQQELDQLRNSLLEMARLAANQLRKSITSLLERDEDLAHEVLFTEKRVNSFELQIDRECELIFALHTPVAHDMRLVFSTLKINADLERIGDYSEGIAKLVLMGGRNFDDELISKLSLRPMFETAYRMMEDITVAYSTDDSRLARSVYKRDKELNEINHAASAIVVAYCAANPDKIAQALYLLSIIRKLERVGDHITNIAEDIIFYKEAIVLKHTPENHGPEDSGI